RIIDAVKHPVPEDAPFPAGLRGGGVEAAPETEAADGSATVPAAEADAQDAARDVDGAADQKE
ncbi:MAG: 50S ribosomal protein L3, partial [Proteobacteria bacterium]|nr:50S ribosomal protein L3 [Pseudomonadota bacterium]